jgi:hypothetical protein
MAKSETTAQAVPAWKAGLRVGPQKVPPRVCIYGPHGVGKSTLASKFPAPIFISTEDGLDSLDVTSFPKAKVIGDVVDSIKTLLKEDHEFKTVVVDSVDWLVEPLISASINAQYDEKAQAYGKGSVYMAEEFREILQGLDALRLKKGMNVVLIAHAAVIKFEDPRTDPYDRYTPKLPKACNALLQEWADVIAFAAFKVIIKKSDAKGFDAARTRGTTNGERLLHLIENPAYVAKNRYNCPEDIEMTIENLSKFVPLSH